MSTKKKTKKTVVIQGETFTTISALSSRCTAIKNKYNVGETVDDKEDYAFLMDVFSYHEKFYEKLVCDEPMVLVSKAVYGSVSFYLAAPDGDKRALSLLQASRNAFGVKESDSDTLNDFKTAARAAVDPQIQKFRKEWKAQHNVEPEYNDSGELQAPAPFEIDHQPPKEFDTLLFNWVCLNDIPIERTGIDHSNSGRKKFVNKKLEESWIEYHRENAKLRALSIEAHAAVPKPNNDWKTLLKEQSK